MRVIAGREAIDGAFERPIVTVGNFDGLHVGHQAILKTIVQRAHLIGGDAIVYTFDPHPRRVLNPDHAPGLLVTLPQKLELLELAGVDVVILEPFTEEFARTTAEVFVREIILNMAHKLLPCREAASTRPPTDPITARNRARISRSL